VKDYQASLEKLRKDAVDAALIRDLATDKTKRELYSRLREHFSSLADEIEAAMKVRFPSKPDFRGMTLGGSTAR
jgi:hypothetical protein